MLRRFYDDAGETTEEALMDPDSTSATAGEISRRALLGAGVAAGGLLLARPFGAAALTGPAASGARAMSSGGGGTLRVGIPNDINLPAIQVFQASNQPLRRTVFDYLIDKNPDGTYRPALATEWEWSDDNSELVVTLHDGVTFHTGRPFGPDDVVASVEAALAEGSGVQAAQLLKRAAGITASGDNEVTVSFDTPFTSYLDALAMLPMIDIETFEQASSGDEVIGTGPFRWNEWLPGDSLRLDRNPEYWRDGPILDAVEFRVITEPQAMLAAIRSGDLDLVNRMIPRDAASLEGDGYNVVATEGFDVYVGANTAVAPLDDVRVRQAVAYALDRERIAEQVYSGFAEPSAVPWASSTGGVTTEQVERYAFDLEQGRALLEEAGAVGTEIELTSFASDPAYAAVAEIVQFGLSEIGFEVNMMSYDQAQFVEQIQAASFKGLWVTPVALTTMGVTTAVLTANPLKPEGNAHNFATPEYSAAVESLVAATTSDELATATGELTEYLLEQSYHNTVVQAQTPSVGVAELTGVEVDLTLALDLTNAQLA